MPDRDESIQPILILIFIIFILALIGVGGCSFCRGELLGVDEGSPLTAGQTVALEMTWEGDRVDPCSVRWFVDDIEGGDATVGRVSNCGEYTAPENPPGTNPVVVGSRFAPGECADCCPSASSEVPLVR